MANLTLQQMDEASKDQFGMLNDTIESISAVLGDNENYKVKNIGDLRELSGKIKVFMNGKLKQLIDLIERLRLIEEGAEPQSDPPLFINDVQGYFDLTMIEARNIEQKIKDLLPSMSNSMLSRQRPDDAFAASGTNMKHSS